MDLSDKRILIVKPSSLGDVIHTLPVVHALKRTFPSCHVGWIVQEGFRPILDRDPAIGYSTDIYSLGATLYELLTCRPVFEGNTPQEILLQILVREPVAPRRLNSSIPKDLETVVMKAMAKRSEDRYQSAKDLTDDLRRWINTVPVIARRMGSVHRCLSWCRKNLRYVAVMAFLIVVSLSCILPVFGCSVCGPAFMFRHRHPVQSVGSLNEFWKINLFIKNSIIFFNNA